MLTGTTHKGKARDLTHHTPGTERNNTHMHILAAIKSYWNIYAYAYTYAYGYTQTHIHAHTIYIYIYTLFSNILCIAKTLQYTWIKQSFAKLNFVYSLTVEVIHKLDGYQGSLRLEKQKKHWHHHYCITISMQQKYKITQNNEKNVG